MLRNKSLFWPNRSATCSRQSAYTDCQKNNAQINMACFIGLRIKRCPLVCGAVPCRGRCAFAAPYGQGSGQLRYAHLPTALPTLLPPLRLYLSGGFWRARACLNKFDLIPPNKSQIRAPVLFTFSHAKVDPVAPGFHTPEDIPCEQCHLGKSALAFR